MDVVSRYRQAVASFGARVRAVESGQWHLPTPNPGWDVRALVNHMVAENRWAAHLLAGGTVEEAGDAYGGDLVGDDPVGAWDAAATAALLAAADPEVLTRSVQMATGQQSGADYLGRLVVDHTIHTWDLARAIGGDESLDTGLVEFVFAYLEAQAERWRVGGAFGPRLEVTASADRMTQLLALTGRSR